MELHHIVDLTWPRPDGRGYKINVRYADIYAARLAGQKNVGTFKERPTLRRACVNAYFLNK